jgi:hypothetical protein
MAISATNLRYQSPLQLERFTDIASLKSSSPTHTHSSSSTSKSLTQAPISESPTSTKPRPIRGSSSNGPEGEKLQKASSSTVVVLSSDSSSMERSLFTSPFCLLYKKMAREEEGGDEGDSAYGWIYVVTLAALCVCAPLPFWLLQRLRLTGASPQFTYNNKLLLTKRIKAFLPIDSRDHPLTPLKLNSNTVPSLNPC